MRVRQIDRSSTDFQQPVDEVALRRAVVDALPGRSVREVVELDSGLFNNTYRIDADDSAFVLKVAPRSETPVYFVERHLMERERTIAPRLRAAHPLVPEYLSFFEVDGRSAFLQRFVSGRLWHAVESELTQEENAALWRQLGAFARTVHSETGDRFGYPAPFVDAPSWSGFIERNTEGLVEDCRRDGRLYREVEEFVEWLPRFREHLDEVTTPRLLHGDLWPRNVLIDGEGSDIRIAAVIDGERAFWGDPLADWVLILYGVPEPFWDGYGEDLAASGDPVRIDLYKGMYFVLNILEAGRLDASDDEPRQWLAEVNERMRGLA